MVWWVVSKGKYCVEKGALFAGGAFELSRFSCSLHNGSKPEPKPHFSQISFHIYMFCVNAIYTYFQSNIWFKRVQSSGQGLPFIWKCHPVGRFSNQIYLQPMLCYAGSGKICNTCMDLNTGQFICLVSNIMSVFSHKTLIRLNSDSK